MSASKDLQTDDKYVFYCTSFEIRFGCDLAYTPMIISDSFVKSSKARDMEFTTNAGKASLIQLTLISFHAIP